MAHYWRLKIDSKLDQPAIKNLLSAALPEFVWRMGDSDAIGLYITGLGPAHEMVSLDIEDTLVDVSIDTGRVTHGEASAASTALVKTLIEAILPSIGRVVSVKEM
jgi:hypothetical protein